MRKLLKEHEIGAVALAIYKSKPNDKEKKPAFLTAADLGVPFVVYSSVMIGCYYVDMRVIPSFKQNYRVIMNNAYKLVERAVEKEDIDFVASTESAGISFGQTLSDMLNVPFAFGRKDGR